MSTEKTSKAGSEKDQHRPSHVRLPGFILDEEIGLGDIIKRTTYAMGIKPCSGCDKRAAALNQWMVLTPGSNR
jgi:hypothetical protein